MGGSLPQWLIDPYKVNIFLLIIKVDWCCHSDQILEDCYHFTLTTVCWKKRCYWQQSILMQH